MRKAKKHDDRNQRTRDQAPAKDTIRSVGPRQLEQVAGGWANLPGQGI